MLEGNVPLLASTLNTFLMDIQPPGKRKNPVAYWKVKFDASQQLVRELEKKKKIIPAVGTSGACNSTESQTKIVQKKTNCCPSSWL